MAPCGVVRPSGSGAGVWARSLPASEMSPTSVRARGFGRRLSNVVMKSEFTFLVSPRTWQSGYRGADVGNSIDAHQSEFSIRALEG